MANPQTDRTGGDAGASSLSANSGEGNGPSSSTADGGEEYITSLTPNDVLCGRGSGPNDHSGNIKFRQLVLSRKAEYLSTNARQTKARIAQEIVDHVKTSMSPPGRFLKKVDNDAAIEAGFPRGAEVWTLVTEDVALEKAKQALRQNRDKHLIAAELAEAQAAAAAAAGGGGSGGRGGGMIAKPQPRYGGPPPQTDSGGYGAHPPHGHRVTPSSSAGPSAPPYFVPSVGGDPYRDDRPYGVGGGDPYYGGGGGGGPQRGSSGGYGPGGGGDYGSMPYQDGAPMGGSCPPGPPPPMPHPGAAHSSSLPSTMGPPMMRNPQRGSTGAVRQSITITDLERDFQSGAQLRHSGNSAGGVPGGGPGGGGGYDGAAHPSPTYSRPHYQDQRTGPGGLGPMSPPLASPQGHGGGSSMMGMARHPNQPSNQLQRPQQHPASLPEDSEVVHVPQNQPQQTAGKTAGEQAFEECFPYALGGRGPSAENMPDAKAPSSNAMPADSLNPLPASRSQGGRGASELRLSGRTMNFIEKAFDGSSSTLIAAGGGGGGGGAGAGEGMTRRESGRGMAQRQRQYQMMGMRSPGGGGGGADGGAAAARGGISEAVASPVTSPPNGGNGDATDANAAVTFADGAPEPGTIGPEDMDRRRLSTMSDISCMSMSMSLSDINASKDLSKWVKSNGQSMGDGAGGGNGGPTAENAKVIEAIIEGKNEEESSSTLEGKGGSSHSEGGKAEGRSSATTNAAQTAVGMASTKSMGSTAEPRRISSIQKKPDSLDEFGLSSMSIMKGLGGMESSSTFSAMSVLMSEASDIESSRDRLRGGTGRGGSDLS